jgi:hypothetical protein
MQHHGLRRGDAFVRPAERSSARLGDGKTSDRAALDWADEDICPYVGRDGAWFVVAGCRIISSAWLTIHRWF